MLSEYKTHSTTYLLLVIAFLLSAFLLFIFPASSLYKNITAKNTYFTGDPGLSYTVAQAVIVEKKLPLLGQPSHLHGRHLIPFYYLTLSALKLVSNGDTLLAIKFETLLKMMAVFTLIILLTLKLHIGSTCFFSKTAVFSYLIFIAFSLRYPHIYQGSWVNNFLLIPLVACLISFWISLDGKLNHFLFFTILASLTAGTFLGAIPFVATLWLIALFKFIRTNFHSIRQVNFRPSLKTTILILLLLVTWLPTVLWELYYPSNFLEILRRGDSHLQPSINLVQVLNMLESYFDSFVIPSSILNFKIALLGVIILICYYYIVADKQQRIFICSVFFATLITLVSLLLIHSKPHNLYLRALLPLGIIIHALFIILVTRVISSLGRIPTFIVTGICLYLAVLTSFKLEQYQVERPYLASLNGQTEINNLIREAVGKNTSFKLVSVGPEKLKIVPVHNDLSEKFVLSNNYYASRIKELNSFKSKKLKNTSAHYLILVHLSSTDFSKSITYKKLLKKYSNYFNFNRAQEISSSEYTEIKNYTFLKIPSALRERQL